MPTAPRTRVPAPSPLLRIRARSIVLVVALLGLTVVAMRMVAAAERVIGWMLVAAAVAGLLHPVVEALSRRMPRGIAVLLVVVASLGVIAGAVYGVVGDVRDATTRLQRAAPEAAREIERSERFGDLARSVQLGDRTRDFVDDVPRRLRGGTPAEALRSAATRGVAFLTTSVLTLFLVLHGTALVEGALNQVRDPERRQRYRDIASTAYRRGFGYARGTLVVALLAGAIAYVVARALDVPGAAALALWVALWDVVPIVGALVGGVPIVVLAAVDSPTKGVLAALVVLAYQIFEDLVLQREVERRSMRLGPFLTVASGLAGFELRGATGALLGVLGVAFAAALLDAAAEADTPTP